MKHKSACNSSYPVMTFHLLYKDVIRLVMNNTARHSVVVYISYRIARWQNDATFLPAFNNAAWKGLETLCNRAEADTEASSACLCRLSLSMRWMSCKVWSDGKNVFCSLLKSVFGFLCFISYLTDFFCRCRFIHGLSIWAARSPTAFPALQASNFHKRKTWSFF